MASHADRAAPRVKTERRPQDVGLIVGGLVMLLVAAWLASADSVSALEEDVFRFVNEWPDRIETPLWLVMQAGSAAAIVISALVVLALWRNGRCAFALLLSGWVAWIGAKAVKQLAQRERPGVLLDDVIQRPEWEGLGFVSGHAAVAFALASVAAPYVAGRWRLVLWAVAVATGTLRIYTGAHLPLDVVGGAALGVAIGGAVNLALGVPARVAAGTRIESTAA